VFTKTKSISIFETRLCVSGNNKRNFFVVNKIMIETPIDFHERVSLYMSYE